MKLNEMNGVADAITNTIQCNIMIWCYYYNYSEIAVITNFDSF